MTGIRVRVCGDVDVSLVQPASIWCPLLQADVLRAALQSGGGGQAGNDGPRAELAHGG